MGQRTEEMPPGVYSIASNKSLRGGECKTYRIPVAGRVHHVLAHIYLFGGKLPLKFVKSTAYNNDHITLPEVLGLITVNREKRGRYWLALTPVGLRALACLEEAKPLTLERGEAIIQHALGTLPRGHILSTVDTYWLVRRGVGTVKVDVEVNKERYEYYCNRYFRPSKKT